MRNKRTKVIWTFILLFGIPITILVNSCDQLPENLKTGNYYDKKIPYNLQDSIPFYSSPLKFTRFISPMGDEIEMQEVEFDGCRYIITTNSSGTSTNPFVIHSPKCPNHESNN